MLPLHLYNVMITLSIEKLTLTFFSPSRQQDEKWLCISCNRAFAQTNGYTNLCHHIRSNRQSEISSRHAESTHRRRNTFQSLTYAHKTLLECVLRTLQPLIFVENARFCQNFKWDSISRHTLMVCIGKLYV